ncbi:hypothetical protein MN116_004214 [Schistosoma mekongi]|uniref:Uncharacterized protein n=1 Tax=Schistosoma mekongi TaxID=38744 RepID=A0AAE2D6H8_SCHME|nr:hypothetical protein MN116_004214 [Schistosoma mekongi]
MYISKCLVLLIVNTFLTAYTENGFNQIDSPTIIDTLTFPLIIDDLNEKIDSQKPPIKKQTIPKNQYPTDPISTTRINANQSDNKSKYFDKQTFVNEFNYSLFEVDESLCPHVYCYAKRLSSSDELTFDCKEKSTEINNEDTMIDCHFWRVPSPGSDSIQPQQSKQHGKGFDLRIVLKPSTVSAEEFSSKSGSVARLRISHLKSGIFDWIIQTVRSHLKMTLSPVHLTISFIYFKSLGRDDLGNLATKSHVTHLSLWNPFNWDEDSFIPLANQSLESSNNSSYLTESPPYFRLSLFCDYENQNPSFRRLWFPWKSWQLRLTHCPNLYICRQWYNKYPICDTRYLVDNVEISVKSFMPSYFISPKLLANASQSPRQESGMQLLYNNQCRLELNQTNLVSDLKIDHLGQCLRSDAYKSAFVIYQNETALQQTSELPTTTATTSTKTTSTHTRTKHVITPKASLPTTTTSMLPVTTSIFTAAETTAVFMTVNTTTYSPKSTSNRKSRIEAVTKMNDTINYLDVYPIKKFVTESSNRVKTVLDHRSELNKPTVFEMNQDTLNKEGVSIEYLISGLILLGILNIVLIFCFIILVLWIRRRIKNSTKATLNKLTNLNKLYQDYTGIDIPGNNDNYATNNCPLLISTTSCTYLSESHPKLNQRHNSFPNNSLSCFQNFDHYLPVSNIKTTNNNTNQSQQYLLGRSTSYSSSMWNGSLRNSLNNTEKVSSSNRMYFHTSKRNLNCSLNDHSMESSQRITSTPYSNRKDRRQHFNLPLPYIGSKYGLQTSNSPLVSSSSSTAVNVQEIIAQKERQRKYLYSSRTRLSSGQPSPAPLHEIKKSPMLNYRKNQKYFSSGRPPLATAIKKPHTLIFENDNGIDRSEWKENFKTSLHEIQ